jgi:hypothetical protein
MAFRMEDTVSKESSDFIEELLKSEDIDEIEKGIEQIGESPKLMTIYRRLEMLKSK